MVSTGKPRPAPSGLHREALLFTLLFTLAYAALATTFVTRAPRLFDHLDQVFDADLGLWTIYLTHLDGPFFHNPVHPLIPLLLLPWGAALRELLRWCGVEMAGRLAAGLLCAVAGGATVGAFRLLLERLGVGAARGLAFTLVFALSATQVVFSSVPESYAFSALTLVLVFWTAASPRRSAAARLAAGVFSFGVTTTNLVAVALAHLDWRRDGRRAPGVALRSLGLVLLVAAALAVLQQALFPGARPFFFRGPLSGAYASSLLRPSSPRELAERTARVATHLVFVGLVAPRVTVDEVNRPRVSIDFGSSPIPALRPAGAAHAVLWGALVTTALWGLRRGGKEKRGVSIALLGWLAFVGTLHLFFGLSLFLYSGHWVFAVVALTAAGLEASAAGGVRGRLVDAVVVLSVVLQAAANASLVADVLRVFSGP